MIRLSQTLRLFLLRTLKSSATLIAFLPLILFANGCSSYLRAPFCATTLKSFPRDFQGIYDVTIPTQSAEWGANMLLRTTQIELKEDRLLASNNLPGFNSDARICQVKGRYFAEQTNADGTYSVSEFTKFSNGLIISALAIDLEAVRKAKLGIQYLPKGFNFMTDEESNGFSVGLTNSLFILDNRSMTSESVLGFTTPVSFQTVLHKRPQLTSLTRAKHTIHLQGINL